MDLDKSHRVLIQIQVPFDEARLKVEYIITRLFWKLRRVHTVLNFYFFYFFFYFLIRHNLKGLISIAQWNQVQLKWNKMSTCQINVSIH